MFVCNNCGRFFVEPLQGKESAGGCHGSPAEEYYSVCPYCFGSDYSDYGDLTQRVIYMEDPEQNV